MDDEKKALLEFLGCQRASILAIIDGLDAEALTASVLPLSSPPRARHPGALGDQITDLRGIILHMIEETARHAGHLDIVRELMDGRTGLGPR